MFLPILFTRPEGKTLAFTGDSSVPGGVLCTLVGFGNSAAGTLPGGSAGLG